MSKKNRRLIRKSRSIQHGEQLINELRNKNKRKDNNSNRRGGGKFTEMSNLKIKYFFFENFDY